PPSPLLTRLPDTYYNLPGPVLRAVRGLPPPSSSSSPFSLSFSRLVTCGVTLYKRARGRAILELTTSRRSFCRSGRLLPPLNRGPSVREMEMAAAGGRGVEVEEGVMRVLLVDDSPVDRRVAQLLLSSDSCAGSFHVIAVDSAKKAMEFLGLKDGKEQAIDMVLTDYCMPEMTGYDLLKAIKALNPLKPIPVIVMSSEDEPQRISRCLNAGAEDFIVKPLQSKDVQRLRNCSTVKPNKAAAPPCDAVAKRKLPPPSAGAGTALPSGRRANLAGVSMVLHSSSVELSQYFPLLLKLVVLVYAVLCAGEILHKWSSGGGGCSLSARWCP
ncbi:unnamed protein product, partial [Urochloa humidicola]